MNSKRQMQLLLSFMAACLILTVIGCKDFITWVLETAPVMIGMVLVVFTWKKFPLTPVLMVLVCIHSLILAVGGHYTYAEVPIGFWIQDIFHFSRNHYDRLGHLFQGFMPAILAREIFIRRNIVQGKWWTFFLALSVCLAFSSFYEMIEWWTALISGAGAVAFLGTQGDIWDTQWDMFFAMVGAISAPLLLSRLHDRQILKIQTKLN